MTALVEVDGLSVDFHTRNGVVNAVRDIGFSLDRGETLGIVGESGSGKSVTAFALMRILDRAGLITGGDMTFGGIDLRAAPEAVMRDLRGREVSMIFQNPRSALNPIRKVGHQIEDVLRQHVQATRQDAKRKAIAMLDRVRIANPEARYHAFPFELSGGMCQRVVIALALACQPRLLIADEPTTGLDVTTQKAIMDLVSDLTREQEMSAILITHDLGLAAAYCDRLIVMRDGKVVEAASTAELFKSPEDAYTRKLMRATPRESANVRDLLPEDDPRAKAPVPDAASEPEPLLEVRDLIKTYPLKRALPALFSQRSEKSEDAFRAVDRISFDIRRGESLGLVGESGCGKSTTSSMIMRLVDPSGGTIRFDGTDIGAIAAHDFAASPSRRRLQMVFQDPTESLNPRFTARRSIADPLLRLGGMANRRALQDRIEETADLVGLPRHLLDRFPHQLSGGQKARVGIARAIAVEPDLLVLDEPTAALDVSVQAVVLNLLVDLKARLSMSYLFVSHDLGVVRLLCDRVMVMKAGRIVESGDTETVMTAPADAYTRSLIDAVPHPPL